MKGSTGRFGCSVSGVGIACPKAVTCKQSGCQEMNKTWPSETRSVASRSLVGHSGRNRRFLALDNVTCQYAGVVTLTLPVRGDQASQRLARSEVEFNLLELPLCDYSCL